MTSTFDPVWRSIEDAVASGRAPGMVAGIRYRGETEIFATGVLAVGSPDAMTEATPFRIASLSKMVLGALAASMLSDGLFDLEDPVDTWLPEMASPRVLVRADGPLDDTVAAERPITIEHLLTLTHGLGLIFEETPLSTAMFNAGVAASAIPPQLTADEFLARVGELPLLHQPGDRWMYNMGCDILSALLPRIAGKSLLELLQQRIFAPARMNSTSFTATHLPTEYVGTENGLEELDDIAGIFEREPPFQTLAGGLVSTVPDYLRFLSALADGRLIPDDLRAAMTSDRLTPAQRESTDLLLGPGTSWGWETGVVTSGSNPGSSTGSYGWTGGTGTSAFVDPSHELLGAVFTQRMMAGPQDNFDYFMDPIAALT
ncbi:MAG TPA: serine hydrolase domain-containing protein [Galbitalea sp.]|nr:serine hydrolase domain-containing protein [Galbitalea sp.]